LGVFFFKIIASAPKIKAPIPANTCIIIAIVKIFSIIIDFYGNKPTTT
jgi:hypothetical protein